MDSIQTFVAQHMEQLIATGHFTYESLKALRSQLAQLDECSKRVAHQKGWLDARIHGAPQLRDPLIVAIAFRGQRVLPDYVPRCFYTRLEHYLMVCCSEDVVVLEPPAHHPLAGHSVFMANVRTDFEVRWASRDNDGNVVLDTHMLWHFQGGRALQRQYNPEAFEALQAEFDTHVAPLVANARRGAPVPPWQDFEPLWRRVMDRVPVQGVLTFHGTVMSKTVRSLNGSAVWDDVHLHFYDMRLAALLLKTETTILLHLTDGAADDDDDDACYYSIQQSKRRFSVSARLDSRNSLEERDLWRYSTPSLDPTRWELMRQWCPTRCTWDVMLSVAERVCNQPKLVQDSRTGALRVCKT